MARLAAPAPAAMDALHPLAQRHYRRNFALGVANGALFSLAEAMRDPTLVLSLFISRLTGSNLLVGLLIPISIGGWFLPQLLLSARVQAAPLKLPFYRLAEVVRVVTTVALALAVFLLPPGPGMAAAALLLIGVNTLTGGLSGLAFTDIVAKVIPSRRRGRFFGLRLFIGGVIALLGSLLARYVLGEPAGFAFPTNFGALFAVAAAAVTASSLSFLMVREPAEEGTPRRAGLAEQLRRARALPRQNPAYGHFLAARFAMMLAEISSPFYIIYARSLLPLPDSVVGVYLLVSTVANTLSTYVWGRVSDGAGNRTLLRLACGAGLGAPLLALAASAIVAPASGSAAALTVVFGAVFALLGMARTGMFMGGTNYLLDVAPPGDRPIYIGLTHTLMGVASLATVLGGVVAEVAGYRALFGVTAALLLLATAAIGRAGEPRAPMAR